MKAIIIAIASMLVFSIHPANASYTVTNINYMSRVIHYEPQTKSGVLGSGISLLELNLMLLQLSTIDITVCQ